MTVGPYQSEGVLFYLLRDAQSSQRKSSKSLCTRGALAGKRRSLLQVSREESVRSGVTSLSVRLARITSGPTEFNSDVIAQVFDGTAEFDEAFLTSDEHGIVCVLLMLKADRERFLVTRNFVRSKLLSNQISTIFKARPAKVHQRTTKLSHVERLRKICLFSDRWLLIVLEYFCRFTKTCTFSVMFIL